MSRVDGLGFLLGVRLILRATAKEKCKEATHYYKSSSILNAHTARNRVEPSFSTSAPSITPTSAPPPSFTGPQLSKKHAIKDVASESVKEPKKSTLNASDFRQKDLRQSKVPSSRFGRLFGYSGSHVPVLTPSNRIFNYRRSHS
jgi:hypothetical protein